MRDAVENGAAGEGGGGTGVAPGGDWDGEDEMRSAQLRGSGKSARRTTCLGGDAGSESGERSTAWMSRPRM